MPRVCVFVCVCLFLGNTLFNRVCFELYIKWNCSVSIYDFFYYVYKIYLVICCHVSFFHDCINYLLQIRHFIYRIYR